MADRIQGIDDKLYSSKDVDQEIQKLKLLQSLDQQATRVKRKSMTIDLRKEKGIRESWKSTIDQVDLAKSLKSDEVYQRIMQSKSQQDIKASPLQQPRSMPKSQIQPDREVSAPPSLYTQQGDSPLVRKITSTKPFRNSNSSMNQITMFNQSAHKQQLNESSSPLKPLSHSSFTESQSIAHSDLNFNEIQHYLDKDVKAYLKGSLKNSPSKFYQTKQSDNTQKQDEIIRKIMQSNSKFTQGNVLQVPKEVLDEIEEYGLDSLSILKAVLSQFQHLFNKYQQQNQDQFNKRGNTQQSSQSSIAKQIRDSLGNQGLFKHQLREKQRKRLSEANSFTLNSKQNLN